MNNNFQDFKDWMNHEIAANGIPAMVVGVHSDTTEHPTIAIGYHDTSTRRPINADPILPGCSQGKFFTATAILKLADEGRLNIQDRITDWLPQYRGVKKLEGVTIRDALSHNTTFTSGFFNMGWIDGSVTPPTSEEFKKMKISDADFDPSGKAGYSNGMYALLGRIAEEASGMRYTDYVKKEILEKHGFIDIYPSYRDVPDNQRDRIPKGYSYDREMPQVDMADLASSGGVYATPKALAHFVHSVASGTSPQGGPILSESTASEMFTPATAHHDGTICGFGVFCHRTEWGEFWGPDGSGPGFRGQTLTGLMSDGQRITVSVARTRNDHKPKSAFPPHDRPTVEPSHYDLMNVMHKAVEAVSQPITAPLRSPRHPAAPITPQAKQARR